jgi:hypothetical protein
MTEGPSPAVCNFRLAISAQYVSFITDMLLTTRVIVVQVDIIKGRIDNSECHDGGLLASRIVEREKMEG